MPRRASRDIGFGHLPHGDRRLNPSVDAELFEKADADLAGELEPLHAILVPGGFGERGTEGKIASVTFAKDRKVPFFGLCLGILDFLLLVG